MGETDLIIRLDRNLLLAFSETISGLIVCLTRSMELHQEGIVKAKPVISASGSKAGVSLTEGAGFPLSENEVLDGCSSSFTDCPLVKFT